MSTTTEQEREECLRKAIVNYRIKCDIRWSDKLEGVITQEEYESCIENELNHVLGLILQRDAQRERLAERTGEVSQLKYLKYFAQMHGLGIDVDDLDHILKSLEQTPDQPLARENLAALGIPSPNPGEKQS